MIRFLSAKRIGFSFFKWVVLDWISYLIYVRVWCSVYHYCTTSFNKSQNQVLWRLKTCSRRDGHWRWWETLVPVGNEAICLLSVKHTIKAIHHHHHHHHHHHQHHHHSLSADAPAIYEILNFHAWLHLL